jgi:ribosomal protein L11 methyltransferase
VSSSNYRLVLSVPKEIQDKSTNTHLDRDEFMGVLWHFLESDGLSGIHEGTVLAENHPEGGSESWTLDAAKAPANRDWVGSQDDLTSDLYFTDEANAKLCGTRIEARFLGPRVLAIEEQPVADWDQLWRDSFTGIDLAPCWEIRPPHLASDPIKKGYHRMILNPGAGFGTGTHETTQLCLEAFSTDQNLKGLNVLDFGSGSGVLSIAAALLGAKVCGVEVDEMAIENAKDNADFNSLSPARIHFYKTLDSLPSDIQYFDLILANILKPILLQYSNEIASRLSPKSGLILSGLIEKDVDEVVETFQPLLGGRAPKIKQKNEWFALVWNIEK